MDFTPTIENRYRLMFRFYDLNKDGFFDRIDQNTILENIDNAYTGESAKKMKTETSKWWLMLEKLGFKGAVNEDQYTAATRFLLEKDFEKTRKLAYKAFQSSFEVIDTDNDNRISLGELVKYYACYNVTDTERVKKIFDKLDLDKDGFVTRDEWILARMDFATRDDPDHDFGFMLDFRLRKKAQASSPVPENSSSGRLTPNLLKRYKTAFRFYDTNKDGVHTLADYLLACDNMCNLYKGGEEERAALWHTGQAWWKQMEPMAINGKITEEHYVYTMITKLVMDFDQTRLDAFQLYRPWFNFVDHDSDGLVSEGEFLNLYTAYNVNDTEKVKNIFQKIDLDEDGFISEEEWILANLDYWTRDDSTYDYGFLYDVE